VNRTDSVKHELDAHLAEYNSLRTDIYGRIQNQQNLIYISIATVAGMLAIADKVVQSEETLFLLLCGSLLLVGIGCLYLREDATLTTIAAYGSTVLAPKITAAIHRLADQQNTTVSESILAWEHFKFHFQFDRRADRLAHRLLLMARYWLMWFPALSFSVAYAVLRYAGLSDKPMEWFEVILALIDFAGLVGLTVGIIVAFLASQRLLTSAGVTERHPSLTTNHAITEHSDKPVAPG
jgi:hypothetical protein